VIGDTTLLARSSRPFAMVMSPLVIVSIVNTVRRMGLRANDPMLGPRRWAWPPVDTGSGAEPPREQGMTLPSKNLRRVPASRDQVREAIDRLAPGRPASTAFHLALPNTTSTGFSVRREQGMWTWRGVSTAHQDAVDASCALAALGWVDQDRFVDLSLDPLNWLKPIRTGAQIVVFGLDVLFDKPLLSVPAVLGPDEALRAACLVVQGVVSPGDNVDTAAGVMVVRENVGCWSLVPQTM